MSKTKRSPSRPALTVHLMGNAHLDPAWLWPWTEGYTETLGVAETALRVMDMFDDFTFIRSSAQSYEWLDEYNPKLFDQVKRRVRDGRWDPVGGWWEQPDMNIPSAESFLRQGLYGQGYFQKHLGRTAKVGYCVDSFGHPAGLPALLRAVGLEGYVFMRPSHGQRPDLTSYFRWQSPDGSEVVGIHIPNYGVWSKDLCATMATAIETRQPGARDMPYMYGFGDHGGGPSIENIRQLKAIEAGDDAAAIKYGADAKELKHLREVMKAAGVKRMVFGTYTDLIGRITKPATLKTMPLVRTHLQHYAQGTYTSISAIKRNIRQLENDLYLAESITVAAKRMGLRLPDPKPLLDEAWKSVLFNQFHDLGAGSCFIEATEDCVRHLEHGRHIASLAANNAAQKMYRAIDARKEEFSTMFFNPLPWAVTTCLELPWAPGPKDERGRKVPFQYIARESYSRGVAGRTAVVATLPPCGASLYYNTRETPPSPPDRKGMLTCDGPLADELLKMFEGVRLDDLDATVAAQVLHGPKRSATAGLSNRGRAKTCSMENEHIRVRFDRAGRLASVYHKPTKVEMLAGPVEPMIVRDDRDAWGHLPANKMPGKFDRKIGAAKGQGAQVIEAGQIRCIVATNYTWGNSRVRIEWRLARHLPYLDAVVECNWQDRHTMVKLAVPTALKKPTATIDTPVAPIEVPTEGVEEPCQKWIALDGTLGRKKVGVALANDAKYGCSFQGATMMLTLLRTAHMAHMGYRGEKPPERSMRLYMDMGLQYLKVRLIPHTGDWRAARVQRLAMELNVGPLVLRGGWHPGKLACGDVPALAVTPANVLALAVKPADRGTGTVVRLWESAGKATSANVKVGDKTAKVRLGRYQLKTLLLTERAGRLKATETDALEQPIKRR